MAQVFKPSEPHPDGGGYYWHITDEEYKHIDDMLGCDLRPIVKSTAVTVDRAPCKSCGKLSGFDDLIENALRWGIHSKEFMIRFLKGDIEQGQSPGHHIECSNCKIAFGIIPWWMESPTIWRK